MEAEFSGSHSPHVPIPGKPPDGHGSKRVLLDDRVFNDLCYPWSDALTVNLLGKSIGFTQKNDLRLKQSWRLSVGFDLMDVGHGFFMVKFDHEMDRLKIVNGVLETLINRWWGKFGFKIIGTKLSTRAFTLYICSSSGCYGHVNGGSSPATALLRPVTAQSRTSQVLMLILKIKPHKLYN
ncbi:hypothetical protein Peur_001217 [Populus x canadensis]